MTPSEGQVNDRIALDMEARESHLLMAAKNTESCSHTLTKLNIISSSFHYYDGGVLSSAKKHKNISSDPRPR